MTSPKTYIGVDFARDWIDVFSASPVFQSTRSFHQMGERSDWRRHANL
ncbi:MAG: hypothetical protein RIA09_19980 [Hoeflea sp.]